MTPANDWSLSHVEILAPPLRRVLLFGSFTQLFSYLACVAALLLPVLLYVDPRPELAAMLAAGALAGSLPAVLAALPARLVVRIGASPTVDALEHHLDGVMRHMGYVPQRAAGVRHYRPRRNWWARWREYDFLVRHAADHIVVTGPRSALLRLRQQTAAWLASN